MSVDLPSQAGRAAGRPGGRAAGHGRLVTDLLTLLTLCRSLQIFVQRFAPASGGASCLASSVDHGAARAGSPVWLSITSAHAKRNEVLVNKPRGGCEGERCSQCSHVAIKVPSSIFSISS